MNLTGGRTLGWLCALTIQLAACGGVQGAATTEALLDIAGPASTVAQQSTTAATTDHGTLSGAAERAARELVAAWKSGDVAAVTTLWDDPENHYGWEIEFDLALGGRWSDVSCRPGLNGGTRCDLLYTNDLLAALGAEPLAGYFVIEVDELGMITGWRYDKGNVVTTQATLRPFPEWLQENHPEVLDAMFDWWDGFTWSPRLTPESRDLWVDEIAEFIATLG